MAIKNCGGCTKWMKCTCPREARGGKPAVNTPACIEFDPNKFFGKKWDGEKWVKEC